eukprot:gene26818-24656_t
MATTLPLLLTATFAPKRDAEADRVLALATRQTAGGADPTDTGTTAAAAFGDGAAVVAAGLTGAAHLNGAEGV